MNASTAKGIKDIVAVFQTGGYVNSGSGTVLTWTACEKLEKALHELAEGIKLDREGRDDDLPYNPMGN